MRDNFNISALSNNMFNNLNPLIPIPNSPVVTMTNISTNVYYGYQSLPAKNDHRDLTVDENTAMEIQHNYLPENPAHKPEILDVLNRKRRCSEQKLEFKKRRLTDNFSDISTE
ncbi:hypothetical protein WA026_009444 [Henosepilachna vigintioctopunctata]|uniref:Uncharacterized protein n=1 Tax=Henosepilachna vigintioctopunctata TaxID=420089 RepID=A0AAW1U4Y6_9CUCU